MTTEAVDYVGFLRDRASFVPLPTQGKILAAEKRFIQVTGGEQSGKHLALDTPVPTPDGWQTIDSLNLGDMVFDEMGQPTVVEWVSPVEVLEAYRLSFDNGTSIIASGTHPWLTRNYNARKHGYAPKVRTTIELLEGGLRRAAPQNHRLFANWSIAAPLPLALPVQELPVPPYVLGAWLGDGTSASASITIADEEIVTNLAWCGVDLRKQRGQYVYGLGGVALLERKHTSASRAASLQGKLRSLGVLHAKHIPSVYLRASVEQRFALLRGLMDTDGYVTKRGPLSFTNTNRALIDGFVELVTSLGMSSRLREGRARLYGKDYGPKWDVAFQTPHTVFGIHRKAVRQRPEKHSERSKNIYITDIVPVGMQQVRCIGVRTSSHLYLAGRGMVPTHNSELAGELLYERWPEDLARAEANHEPLLYWLVADDYDGTRREFEAITAKFSALLGANNVVASKVVNPGTIKIKTQNGLILVETKSAADPRKLRMRAPYGIIGCEASQLDLETFNRIMGRAAPRRAWVLLTGTFEEGSIGWFPQIWRAWQSGADDRQSFSMPTTENFHLYPGGKDDPEILRLKADSSAAWFLERIMGVPVPPKGLVFGEFRPDLHIADVEYVPGHKVYIWEDPGYGSQSAHAIEVAQIINDRVQVFQEFYEQGIITEGMIEMVVAQPWWKERDGAGIHLVSDPHYKDAHHSMTSVGEQWLKDTGLVAGGERGRINSGTERLKGFLKVDPLSGLTKIVFSPRCKGLLSEFGAGPNPFDGQMRPYKWKIDKDGQVYGDTPEDKYNHGVKAIIYGLVDRFGYVTSPDRQVIKVRNRIR